MTAAAIIHQMEDTGSVELTVKKNHPVINVNKRIHVGYSLRIAHFYIEF